MTESKTPGSQGRSPWIAVITCAVFETEITHFARGLDHVVHVEILDQGLHNEPDRLRTTLQAAVDHVEALQPTPDKGPVEAIVLGYGLCSRGIEGVRTRTCQLVMVRAHDCITLLLGGKDRYAAYVKAHPGTYWYSPGWIKHHTPPGPERHDKLRADYHRKYGEDNADYLMEMEQSWMKSYNRTTYVDLSIGASDHDVAYTKRCASWLGWSFDRQRGDPALIEALLAGRWDEDRFVVLDPGQTIRMTADDRVIEPVDAQEHDPSSENAPADGRTFQS